jgi:DNA-directed RNA polymerase specialized sigma24 family protein
MNETLVRKAVALCPTTKVLPNWININEDLIQEAWLAVLESRRTYQEGKSSQDTWAINYIHYRMKSLASKFSESTREIPFSNLSPTTDNEDNDNSINEVPSLESQGFLDIYDGLSNEAKMLVKMILTSPYEFLKDTPRGSRTQVRKHLRKLGWKWNQIWKVINELKSQLSYS